MKNDPWSLVPMGNSNASIGQSVASQTAANVLSGERSYKELKFIATGDVETELINLVNAFVVEFFTQAASTQIFNNRRIATVLDYLAQRYRESAKEMNAEVEKVLPCPVCLGKMSNMNRWNDKSDLGSFPAVLNPGYDWAEVAVATYPLWVCMACLGEGTLNAAAAHILRGLSKDSLMAKQEIIQKVLTALDTQA